MNKKLFSSLTGSLLEMNVAFKFVSLFLQYFLATLWHELVSDYLVLFFPPFSLLIMGGVNLGAVDDIDEEWILGVLVRSC